MLMIEEKLPDQGQVPHLYLPHAICVLMVVLLARQLKTNATSHATKLKLMV